jgi:putative filamentous hemagglutinin
LFLFTIRKNILSQYEQVSDNVLLHKETGEIVNGPFDIGHISGWEHRRLEEAAKQLGLTRQEFNDYVNARPQNFRLENRSKNRSHRNEMPGKNDILDIKQDMRNFMNRGK